MGEAREMWVNITDDLMKPFTNHCYRRIFGSRGEAIVDALSSEHIGYRPLYRLHIRLKAAKDT